MPKDVVKLQSFKAHTYASVEPIRSLDKDMSSSNIKSYSVKTIDCTQMFLMITNSALNAIEVCAEICLKSSFKYGRIMFHILLGTIRRNMWRLTRI